MAELPFYSQCLIALIFVWSGFVRSGLGFGGAVLSLPLLLLIDNQPLVYLPIIAVHLLVFSSITVFQSRRKQQAISSVNSNTLTNTIDWPYLKKALRIMIIPKLIGVFGLLTLPAHLLTGIIFIIVTVYAISYILNKPFTSHHPVADTGFLILGAYISGTSLIGAPLLVSVFSTHVKKYQLRDTLFVLWFILVSIKMTAFFMAGVDFQWHQHLYLLPAATVGHIIGLRFHERIVHSNQVVFYRSLGLALLLVSLTGMYSLYLQA